jgi:hypothetical protein
MLGRIEGLLEQKTRRMDVVSFDIVFVGAPFVVAVFGLN